MLRRLHVATASADEAFSSTTNDTSEVPSSMHAKDDAREITNLVSCLRQLDALGAARSQVVRNMERNVQSAMEFAVDDKFSLQQEQQQLVLPNVRAYLIIRRNVYSHPYVL